jgi:pilus assembly protein CpaB
MVLAALCAGALAALLSFRTLRAQEMEVAAKTRPMLVVVATREIPARTLVTPDMVEETTRPVAALPPNCANSEQEVVGRVAISALAMNEPVQRAAITAQTASLGLAYAVPEGMRAVTVALDSIIGVAGFLKAGDHVDVVATFDMDRMSNAAVAKTVLQDVELLAIGPEVRPEEGQSATGKKGARPKEQPNATLAVTPADAEKLILAESTGKLRLTLRRAGEDLRVSLTGVRSDALIGARPPRPEARPVASRPVAAPRPPVAARARPQEDKVETIRGTCKATVAVRPN